jgi:hypothetical protein
MSQQFRPYLAAFVKAQAEKGISLLQALRMPEALDADLADQRVAAKQDQGRSTSDWIKGVQPDADGKVRFQSSEEFTQAIADPMYKVSESYRQAVAQMADNTDASVLGVSGSLKDSHGNHVKVGRGGLSEKATADTMMRSAYVEMVREKMSKIDRSTATGRYEYLQLLKDPANAEVIAQIESMMVTPEQLRRNELMQLKSEGGETLRVQAQGEITGPYDPRTHPVEAAQHEAETTGGLSPEQRSRLE